MKTKEKTFSVRVHYTTCADADGKYHIRSKIVKISAENAQEAEMLAYLQATYYPDHGNTMYAEIYNPNQK